MTLYRPLHFHMCSLCHCPSEDGEGRSHQLHWHITYDDAPIQCLINHWSTKYTRRLRTLPSPWFFGHPSSLPSKTPTLHRCISPSIDADPRTAGCPWCNLGPFPSFSPFGHDSVPLARHTTVNRIWIDRLFGRPLHSLPHEPNHCFHPASQPLHASTPFPRKRCNTYVISQNKPLGSEHPG